MFNMSLTGIADRPDLQLTFSTFPTFTAQHTVAGRCGVQRARSVKLELAANRIEGSKPSKNEVTY